MATNREDAPGAPLGDTVERAIFDNASDALIMISLDQKVIRWNDAARELLGYRSSEVVGQSLDVLLPAHVRHRHPGLVHGFAEGTRARRSMADGADLSAVHRDGTEIPVDVAIAKVPMGRESYLLASVRDARPRRKAEEALRQRNERLDSILGAVPDEVFRIDAAGRLMQTLQSQPGVSSLGAGAEGDLIADRFTSDSAAEWRAGIDRVATERQPQSIQFHRGGDAGAVFEARLVPLGSDEILAMIRDVTTQARAEEAMARLAVEDPLTRLSNRRHLLLQLDYWLDSESGVGVLLFDLDDFKTINDSMGHDAGDRLLVAIADRLHEGWLPESAVVGRLGGDEFVVAVPGVDSERELNDVARRTVEEVSGPITVDARSFSLTVSLGAVLARPGSLTSSQAISAADAAMYEAKRDGGRGFRVFDDELRVWLDRRFELERRLQGAVERDELRLVFQPLLTMSNQRWAGAEALIRWNLDGSVVNPAEFIPLAESTGLIRELGLWVFGEAFRRAQGWTPSTSGPTTVGVNVSPGQLNDTNLVDQLIDLAGEHEFDLSRLTVEVTETSVLEPSVTVLGNLDRLRSVGCGIALDDFGTGYATFATLRSLPITDIKIDRVFTQGVGVSTEDEAIVASIIGLAKALGVRSIGEGIETPEQYWRLAELGCDVAQGFWLARPMAPGDCGDVLDAPPTALG